jgi:alpha-L-fucosidase
LGLNSKQEPNEVSAIRLIGSNEQIEFEQNEDRFILTVPEKRPNKYASVFEIKGAL